MTHRKLEWKETAHEEPEAEPLSWKDRLLCRGSKPPKHVMCVFEREGSSAARVLQGGLQPKLGRPLLLSGQWSSNTATRTLTLTLTFFLTLNFILP